MQEISKSVETRASYKEYNTKQEILVGEKFGKLAKYIYI